MALPPRSFLVSPKKSATNCDTTNYIPACITRLSAIYFVTIGGGPVEARALVRGGFDLAQNPRIPTSGVPVPRVSAPHEALRAAQAFGFDLPRQFCICPAWLCGVVRR